ncbi:RNA polymerase sigma factor [Catellatospora aurea]|uniref:RNA polymerase sigma factor n=1 Tax=Catellatospora aurea TaxID=1337874 RepID=A0ABW2H1Z0_9ACTN
MKSGTPRDTDWHAKLCEASDGQIAKFALSVLEPSLRHLFEEVVQGVREVSWKKREQVPDGDDALRWLLGVAANEVKRVRRAEARHRDRRAPMGQIPERPTPSAEESVVDSDVWRVLMEAAGDEVDGQILNLVYNQGLTHAEVGAALQPLYPKVKLTPGNVAQRLKRARDQIAARIGQDPQRFILGGDQS